MNPLVPVVFHTKGREVDSVIYLNGSDTAVIIASDSTLMLESGVQYRIKTVSSVGAQFGGWGLKGACSFPDQGNPDSVVDIWLETAQAGMAEIYANWFKPYPPAGG